MTPLKIKSRNLIESHLAKKELQNEKLRISNLQKCRLLEVYESIGLKTEI